MLLFTAKNIYFKNIPFGEASLLVELWTYNNFLGILDPLHSTLPLSVNLQLCLNTVFLAPQSPECMKDFPLSTWETSPQLGKSLTLPLFPCPGSTSTCSNPGQEAPLVPRKEALPAAYSKGSAF